VTMDHERYETEFAAETSRLAAVAAALGPSRAVVTCPEWTVRDLITHVRRGHRWATVIVEQRLTSPPPFGEEAPPGDPAGWPEWLGAGARGLTDAIREAGPSCPVWTWQQDPTAGFWLRRMLHDLLVHRYDAELTAGAPGPVAADLAADGVCDMLDTVATLSGRAFAALAGTGETLRFEATDHPSVWTARRAPDGVTWSDDRAGTATVTVRAPARELLLLLNRRFTPAHDALEVTGNRALLDHWWENTKF
jgi:uncharacterized protein (TIGR03083 family)